MVKSFLINGDCLETLKKRADNSIDSLVTDPPAGISFMGKEWDDDKGGRKQWIAWMTEVMTECLRVLKPGAHGLVWALPRTSHWTATALEDAGFEVRDVVTPLFGTGFPKSMDISKAIDKQAGAEREVVGEKVKLQSYGRDTPTGYGGDVDRGGVMQITAPATPAAKQWEGWGTALKPASEHWILVRKPISEKTVAANVLKYGTGGLNIDECRVDAKPRKTGTVTPGDAATGTGDTVTGSSRTRQIEYDAKDQGRFPANLVLDEEAAQALDEQSGVSKSNSGGKSGKTRVHNPGLGVTDRGGHDDSGGASRFFYVAKASKSDKGTDNTHPTVKSTKLMEYLIKLVTPPNGIVLDPFMGSGTTGVSAVELGHKFIGIEQSPEYFEIATKRLKGAEGE